jgi:hypothetical protein
MASQGRAAKIVMTIFERLTTIDKEKSPARCRAFCYLNNLSSFGGNK